MNNAFPSRAALALTLACGLALAAAPSAHAARPAAEEAASQPANAVRPEFAAPFNAAQEALKSGNGAVALAKIKDADAVPNNTPFEKYLVLRVRAPAEYMTGDLAHAATDFEALLADEHLAGADREAMSQLLVQVLYQGQQYPKAAAAARRYLDAGGTNPQIREIEAQSLYLIPDYPAAAKAYQAVVAAQVAAGKQPTEKTLRLLASAQNQAKDDAAYGATLERLAVAYPKADYWKDLINRAMRVEKLNDRTAVDSERLKAAAFGEVPAGDRLGYADAAFRTGYPAEAKRLIDEGKAKNAFEPGEMADANKLQASAGKAAAADRAQAAANEQSARSAKDGNALAALGTAVAVDGDPKRGAAMIQAGIDKGGLKFPEEARLHLGYAQYLSGDYAAAGKTFQAVAPAGTVGALAHVWTLLAQSKSQPPAVASSSTN